MAAILTACFGVVSKCREWSDPQTCDPRRVRGMLLGFVMNVTLAEVVAYKVLQQDVRGGELGRRVPELVLVSVSCLEALAAPLVSWFGARRRMTLGLWMLAPLVCLTSWFALPGANVREESEFCDAANQNNDTTFSGMTLESTVRLAVVVVTSCVLAVSRVAVWAHGMAILEEHGSDRITVHYSLILNGRVLLLILGHRIMTMTDTNFSMQVLIIVLSMLPPLAQLPFVVSRGDADEGTQEPLVATGRDNWLRTGFLGSLGRVCRNGLAVSQMVALALLATALWGYGYLEGDIIRTKFLLNQVVPGSDNFVKMVRYGLMFYALMYVATTFSAPALEQYCRTKAVRHVTVMCVLVAALFAALVLPSCEHGAVAGLGAEYYGHPECSFRCGCRPGWQEFSPVCDTGEMVTYLSPCHAGCAAADTVNGINVYVNCTCAGAARTLAGGCTEGACQFALNLHQAVFVVLLTIAMLAFQTQAVLVLKSVERRDRSVAAGLTMAAVAALAFVVGPLLYQGIDAKSCRWFEGDKCHLFNDKFPKIVGFTSAFIALLAALMCIVSCICVRMAERSKSNKRNEPSEDIELS